MAARIGYAAKAVVYATLATLSGMAAAGVAGGRLTDSKGALRALGQQPLGTVVLWAGAAGLLCYAAWSGVRATLDPEHKGTGLGALFARAGYLISFGVHLVLAIYAAKLAYGLRPHSEGTQTHVAKLLHLPFGAVFLVLGGFGVIGFGIAQIVKAVRGKVGHQYAHAALRSGLHRAVLRMARVGVFTRGVVFLVVGGSLLTAAYQHDASEASGFDDALVVLSHSPLGASLLIFVAAGLFVYGLHLLAVACWGSLPEPR